MDVAVLSLAYHGVNVTGRASVMWSMEGAEQRCRARPIGLEDRSVDRLHQSLSDRDLT
jgi:hypothetical protein